MSCEHDGDFAYGRIDSPIADPPMIDRCLGMDPDDATFCNWLSDMILSTSHNNPIFAMFDYMDI